MDRQYMESSLPFSSGSDHVLLLDKFPYGSPLPSCAEPPFFHTCRCSFRSPGVPIRRKCEQIILRMRRHVCDCMCDHGCFLLLTDVSGYTGR